MRRQTHDETQSREVGFCVNIRHEPDGAYRRAAGCWPRPPERGAWREKLLQKDLTRKVEQTVRGFFEGDHAASVSEGICSNLWWKLRYQFRPNSLHHCP